MIWNISSVRQPKGMQPIFALNPTPGMQGNTALTKISTKCCWITSHQGSFLVSPPPSNSQENNHWETAETASERSQQDGSKFWHKLFDMCSSSMC